MLIHPASGLVFRSKLVSGRGGGAASRLILVARSTLVGGHDRWLLRQRVGDGRHHGGRGRRGHGRVHGAGHAPVHGRGGWNGSYVGGATVLKWRAGSQG